MKLLMNAKNLFSAVLFVVMALFGATSSFAADGMNESLKVADKVTEVKSININTASAQSLAETLNGVGSKKAAEIVAFREANGAFASAIEITEVNGIGEATFERNKDLIRTQ